MSAIVAPVAAAPRCPRCNGLMVKRTSKFGEFWGCRAYPRCKGTKPVTQARTVSPIKLISGSVEQESIWSLLQNDDCHIVVNALAGTGKSFTCRQGMFRLPEVRIGYFVFGKDIRTEFSADAPSNCDVATFNSVGYRVCRQVFPQAVLHDDKVCDLFDELWHPASQEDNDAARTLKNAVEKLVALAQGYLVDGTNEEELLELAARHDVELSSDIEEKALALVPQVLALDRQRVNVLSFNDQVWLPVVLDLPCPKFDLLFVDEAQDMNPLQHAFVLRMLAPGGRVVIVGDENQAIYGFRGSDVDSIRSMTALLEATGKLVKGMPLTVTRRCSKAVTREAQKYVPEIRALDDAPEGEVINTTMKDVLSRDGIQPGNMVVCRTNAPLTGIAYGLIRRGVKAVIRGRDIGQGLISIVKKLRASGMNDLLTKLDKWQAKEVSKVAGTKREESVVQRITDQGDCIRALSDDLEEVSDLIARIESIFANFEATGAPKGAVILSSIHRAKGLEAEKVIWAYPEIACKATQEWQARQEKNLHYVAVTRAKLVLVQASER